MINFTKENLFYNDYTWTPKKANDPKISGKLDDTRFNWREGEEVLFIINKIIPLWDLTRIESCTRIERIIREKLPNSINTQEEVVTWIQINWKNIKLVENVVGKI